MDDKLLLKRTKIAEINENEDFEDQITNLPEKKDS
jgi:hypothetical protein